MSSRASAVLAIFVVSLCLGGDQPSTNSPKSPAGHAAIQKFEAAKAKADEAYRVAVAAALKAEIADMEAARQAAMKADNLEEAERCAAAKKAAQEKAEANSPTALIRGISGTSWRMPANGAILIYSDGTLTCDRWPAGKSCEWRSIDQNSILQVEPDGNEIRVTFTSDRRAAVFQYQSGSKAGGVGYAVALGG